MELGSFVKAGGQSIGPDVSPGGKGAPAGGIVPAVALSGGVGVDGDEDDVVFSQLAAPLVHAAAALGQRDVFRFGYEEGGIVAEVGQGADHTASNQPVPGVLPEYAIWAALARSFGAVAIFDKNFRWQYTIGHNS